MDAVSHLLRLARLEASLDKRCLLGGSTRMDVAAHDARQAPFHVLLEGTCQLEVGAHVLTLRAGDVVVIPRGGQHRVTTPGSQRMTGIVETPGEAFTTTRSERGGAPVIDLFCGHYTFGAGAGAILFESLPEPMHVSFGQSPETDSVLRMLSTLMRDEAARDGDGTAAILSALCTALLAMMLRTARGATTDASLWTAVADDRIGKAIAGILDDPGADWSIERLSRSAAMSRATFIRRFSRGTGMTVGAFLTRVRLMTASELLLTTDSTIASVAARVGYQSESAFSRGFRRAIGVTPARFRRASER
jgi:AraC-like DNA-binding protein/mannose-6-phosphate isomerase-like protein (cupin superfamily)